MTKPGDIIDRFLKGLRPAADRPRVRDRLRHAARCVGWAGVGAASELTGWLPRVRGAASRAVMDRPVVVTLLAVGGVVGGSAGLSLTLHAVLGPAAGHDDVAGGLLTAAEVLGGVAGFILAVLVFAAEQNVARLGRLSFLAPVALRRGLLIPAVAATLGVVAANVMIGLTAPLWTPLARAAVVLAVLDVVLFPLAVGLVVGQLHEAVHGIAGDLLMTRVKPRLLTEHARHLRGEAAAESERVTATVRTLTQTLEDLARTGTADDLSRALDIHLALAEQCVKLDDGPATELPSHLKFPKTTGFQRESVFEAAQEIRHRGLPDHHEAMRRHGHRLMLLGLDHRAPDCFSLGATTVEILYLGINQLAEHERETCADRFDGFLGFEPNRRLCQIGRDRDLEEDEPASAAAQEAVLWVVRHALELARYAIGLGRGDDAIKFVHRLRHSRSERLPRMPEWSYTDECHDIYTLAEIYLAGWCVRQIERGGETSKAAERLLGWMLTSSSERPLPQGSDEFAGRVPTREALLDAWARASEPQEGGGLINAHMWHDSGPWRSMVVTVRSGHETWPVLGLFALLLVAKPSWGGGAAADPLREPPATDEEARQHVDALLRIPSIATFAAEGAAGTPEKATRGVLDLLAERRRRHGLHRLRETMSRPLAPSQLAALSEAASDHVREHDGLAAFVAGRATRKTSASLARVARQISTPKSLLIEQSDDFLRETWGEVIGSPMGMHHEGLLAGVAADHASKSAAGVDDVADLPAAVEAAADILRREGFEPDLVLLPLPERFVRPFFPDVPLWQVTGREQFGGWHAGRWQGFELFQLAPCWIEAVVVLDSRRFFGRVAAEDAGQVVVELADAREAEHRRLLEEAEREPDGDVPSPGELKVVLRARFLYPGGPVGLGDTRAAVRVPLDVRTLGYVLPPGDGRYHRPGCTEAEGEGTSLCKGLLGEPSREACGVCQPDDWDPDLG